MEQRPETGRVLRRDSAHTPLRCVPARVQVIPPGDPRRPECEQFIGDVYAEFYGAQIRHFLPTFMALRDQNEALLAVLGLQPASGGSLFLEQYLDAAVEAVLNARLAALGASVERSTLMEVGNLAARHPGGTRWLILALTAYLQGAGHDWVVFTAVPSLRNSFQRLGIRMLVLGPAREEQLPLTLRGQWGRYYDGRPQVIAVNVPHTYGLMERYLRRESRAGRLHGMWSHAQATGAGHAEAVA